MAVVREPYGFVHADNSRLKEVYGGPTGQVFVECMRIRPETGDSKTVILFSHTGWREPVEFMHHCSTKWASFLFSLRALLETGAGWPAPNDPPIGDWD